MRRAELAGLALIAVGAVSLCAVLGFSVGAVGGAIAKLLDYGFGIGAVAVPFGIMFLGCKKIMKHEIFSSPPKAVGIAVLAVSLLSLWHFAVIPAGEEILPESLVAGGGLLGGGFLFVLKKFFGEYGAPIILLFVIFAAGLSLSTWSLAKGIMQAKSAAEHGAKKIGGTAKRVAAEHKNKREVSFDDKEDYKRLEESLPIGAGVARNEKSAAQQSAAAEDFSPREEIAAQRPYVLPRIEDILSAGGAEQSADFAAETEKNIRTLEKTLADFRVKAKVAGVVRGPAITRYEIEPAPGVKMSRITNLADDLALALAVPSVRIEPVGGKNVVGIEAPNGKTAPVTLREVLANEKFAAAKSKLTVGLGIDINGDAVFADLAKMPHLLIAGATGSGKSVSINTIVASILFKAAPDEVNFIFIDPKMVELTGYNGIAHLLVPVVTDARESAAVLSGAVDEMESRYKRFADSRVRNIEAYNEKFSAQKMASIVIIIDELADLMMVAPKEIEDSICRLAQKARAAGIHLVLATQRPSVNVITGVIKANIPSRIAFAVSSQVDSRTILDTGGAEKLLGKGDMLFYPAGAAKPIRVQGAFVGDDDIERLLQFVRAQGAVSRDASSFVGAKNAEQTTLSL